MLGGRLLFASMPPQTLSPEAERRCWQPTCCDAPRRCSPSKSDASRPSSKIGVDDDAIRSPARAVESLSAAPCHFRVDLCGATNSSGGHHSCLDALFVGDDGGPVRNRSHRAGWIPPHWAIAFQESVRAQRTASNRGDYVCVARAGNDGARHL